MMKSCEELKTKMELLEAQMAGGRKKK